MSLPATPVHFYIYDHFPRAADLLRCPTVRAHAPFSQPMGQFFAEVYATLDLMHHPWRVNTPEAASLFYVPLLAKLSRVAGSCALGEEPRSSHRERMAASAAMLAASPWFHRANGSDHLFVCTSLDMKPLLGKRLFSTISASQVMHAVHYVPRGAASPANCQLLVPYLAHSVAAAQAVQASPYERVPGTRRFLAHFRGRASSKVRSVLGRRYSRQPNRILLTDWWTTAACNVRNCVPGQIMDRRGGKRVNETSFSWVVMAAEMADSTFCLVPPSESPESSRLYLAVVAGCVPVFLSDDYVGAFPHSVPWERFTLRVPQAELLQPSFILTSHLLTVANTTRLGEMQWLLRAYAADTLWHLPGSRVATNLLELAARARGPQFCGGGGSAAAARAAARSHGIWWTLDHGVARTS